MSIKVCLILVMIHEIQSFFILLVIKVIGKIKYEFKGEIISDFVGLKSKMCSLVNVDGKKNKKAKTVNRNVVKTQGIKTQGIKNLNLLIFCLIKN